MNRSVFIGVLLAGAASAPSIALAQSATATSDEIVVSARKRDETLIAVPVIVSAVRGEELERRGITNLDGIARIVPQLVIGEGAGSRQGGGIVIRGVSGPDANNLSDQAVSVNIDGVQVAKGNVRRMSEVDLAQVEVLKGPQALFFGKNSPGGIISIRTNDPGTRLEVGGTLGFETEADEMRATGYVSTPLSETLGFRLAGIYSTMDGFFKDVSPAGMFKVADRSPDARSYALRGTMLWSPGDRFNARLKVNYGHMKQNGMTAATQYTDCPTGQRQSGTPGLSCNIGTDLITVAGYGPYLSTVGGTLNDFRADGRPHSSQSQILASLELSYDLSDQISLQSITGYYKTRFNSAQVIWPDPAIIPAASLALASEQISQELRLATDFQGAVNFYGGAFYVRSRDETSSYVWLFGGNLPSPFGTLTSPRQFLNILYGQRGTAWSGYGQISIKPTAAFELTAGGRYSYERKRLPVVRQGAGLGQLVLDSSREVATPFRSDSWKDFSAEVTAAYRPSSDLTIFASYKEGFLSGGFNTSNAPAVTDLRYRPQTIRGFEGGVKAALLDRTLLVNISAYDYRLTDLQVAGYIGIIATLNNAGRARTTGIEGEINYTTPLPGLRLNGALSYNNGRYTSFPGAACYAGQTPALGCTISGGAATQDLSGTQLPRAPKWAAATGFAYETPVGRDLALGFDGDLSYSSSYLSDPTSAPRGRQAAYTLLGGSVRLGAEDKRWQVALIGRNLTNRHVFQFTNEVPFTGGGTGTPAGTLSDRYGAVGRGRQLMLQFSAKFGN
ncbi:TonB-dependent receptor [Sphingobium chlorophenolicum L-1]|uniref:TonB-dependent receptor n=1 Tax=Sphingobium chlorophenolicum L-1 TaxID=690566 RepID=F6EW87_SPHCR|nr:TonB-dependent receptor [Sphingobium chlorophenolicum]AEG49781.1 TonB-dependent receptor [Sphingobium chlorophenolicum L-1]